MASGVRYGIARGARGLTSNRQDTSCTSLFLMHHLDGIEANCDSCGIQTGQNGRQKHAYQQTYQNARGPMKLDGPAERLLVNHIDQNERKRETQDESDQIRQQTNQPSFDQNQFSNLRGRGAQKTQ